MIFVLPKKGILDHLNYYFPNTCYQFKTSVTEPSSYRIKAKTKKEKRLFCLRHLVYNGLLSPVQTTGLAVWQSGRAVVAIGDFICLTTILPFTFSENRALWAIGALRVSDAVIAVFTTIFHPLVTCFRLARGLIHPDSYFREPRCLNDRLDILIREHRFSLGTIPPAYSTNKEFISNSIFISALFNYSVKWGLVCSKESSGNLEMRGKGYFRTKAFLARRRNDRVEEKYALLNAFHALVSDSSKCESMEEIVRLAKAHFKSPRQKATLEMFLKKSPGQIAAHAGAFQTIATSDYEDDIQGIISAFSNPK